MKKGGKRAIQILADQAGDASQFRVVLQDPSARAKRARRFKGSNYLLSVPQGDWNIRLFSGKEEWPRLHPTGKLDLANTDRIVFRPRVKDAPLRGEPVPIAAIPSEVGEEATRNTWNELAQLAVHYAECLPLIQRSALRVVLANDTDTAPVFARFESGAKVDWTEAQPAGRFHIARIGAEAGSNIVSLAFSRGLPVSIATFVAPDSTTLIVVHRDAEQKLKIAQLILRRKRLDAGTLKMALEIQADASSDLEPHLYEAIGEPVTRLFGFRLRPMPVHADFGVTFPDLIALRRQRGEVIEQLVGIPLLLDNLLSVPGWEDRLPLPSNRLDYSSLWTCWRGAVNPPQVDTPAIGA
jgi:hypothetical protein